MFTRTESVREFIRFYPIVSWIVSIHIFLYLLTILPVFPYHWFFETFSGVNLYIMKGEIWRLITPTFMHSGFSHMLFNSFSLVLFGPPLEQMLGSRRFLLIYLASGLCANLATFLLEPLTYTHVGSSGAIFGLFGYYIAMIVFRKKWISKEDTQIILGFCAIGLIVTFIQQNINTTAHFFGLFGGFLLGTIPYFNRNRLHESMREAVHLAGRHKLRFSRQSPLKVIFWSVVILFAVIGFLMQR